MEFEWKISKDSLHWAFLERFKNTWKDHLHVNVHRHCVGENEETQKRVLRILLQLRIMLANSCPDTGRSWDLDQRRNGAKPILINGTEIGTKLQK